MSEATKRLTCAELTAALEKITGKVKSPNEAQFILSIGQWGALYRTFSDAADRAEALQAEVDRMRKDLERARRAAKDIVEHTTMKERRYSPYNHDRLKEIAGLV